MVTPLHVQSADRTPSSSILLLSVSSIVLFATIFPVHVAVKFRFIFVSSPVADIVGQDQVAALPIVISLTAVAACDHFRSSLFVLSSIGWFAAKTSAVEVDVPIVTLPLPCHLNTALIFAASQSASNITEVQEAFVILQWFIALAVVSKTSISLPFASAINHKSANLGAVNVLLVSVSALDAVILSFNCVCIAEVTHFTYANSDKDG